MPISKQRRPLAIITGEVIAVEAKAEYDDNGKTTGNVGRYDVTVLQASHATPDVRFPTGFDAPRVPEKGERVALVVDLGETREYGANMRIVRYVTDEDLSAVASFVSLAASK